MRTLLASALVALGTVSSAALAEPIELTDAAMDRVTAGGGFITVGDLALIHDRRGGTLIPSVFGSVRPLSGGSIGLPNEVIDVADDDLIRILSLRRGLRTAPSTVIVLKNIVVVDGRLSD